MSSLYSELTNLFDQDFMSFEEGKPIFDWLYRHREDINNIEIDYLNDISNTQEKVAELEHQLSNCSEPKFKVGQEVWVVDMVLMKIEEHSFVDYITIYEDVIYYSLTNGADYRSDCVFATEEEAKKKLEEIQNDNN